MIFFMSIKLPTALHGLSQASANAADETAPFATRLRSRYYSGQVVQTRRTTF